MNQTEITAAVRRGIREPRPRTVSDADITSATLRAVLGLGMVVKGRDPSFFNKRVSVSSYTHIFPWPSDCLTVLNVWDLGTTAGTITDATNASPINIESVDHGFSDNAIVTIHDVGGNTAANGTFLITKVDDDNFTLDGTTGNAAYTSGGTVFSDPGDMIKMWKINLAEATLSHSDKWYPREKTIVVDDVAFTNDIVIDYEASPDAITDIPTEFHEGLVSACVEELLVVPSREHPTYDDLIGSLAFHRSRLLRIHASIRKSLKASAEPSFIQDDWNEIQGGPYDY